MKILDCANIRVSVCGIFAKPTFKSEMVSQALIDEVVEILDKDGSWYKIRLLYDDYEGWIHEMYLKSSNTRDSNDIVNNKDYSNNLSKTPILYEAFKMLGKPYLWGGRSRQGYDCSGFVQTCISSMGLQFPRDARDQVNSKLLYEIKLENILSGDLLFFEENHLVNHVAIAINFFDKIDNNLSYYGEIIHSSGTVKISKIVFNDASYATVDRDDDKKIKLYKIMRLKDSE